MAAGAHGDCAGIAETGGEDAAPIGTGENSRQGEKPGKQS
jgi:hypothetical protein